MSEIKLLPCPFCGGKAEIVTEKSRVGQVGRVECVKCSCKKTVLKAPNYEGDIEKDITDSWNTRKPMERIIERLEEKKQEYLEGFRVHQENELYGVACGFGDSIKICKKEGVTDECN